MSYLIQEFQERIRKDKNILLVVTGETGSGKSYIALRLGEVLNPGRFTIDNVVFTPDEFMELLNSGTLEKGDVVIFDEAGVGIPAKEWYEISNRLFNYVLQTFRQDNLIVIFTTPSIGFIDGDSRKLLHGVITTLDIDYGRKENIAQYHRIQHNPRFNKTYYKYKKENGMKINPLRIKKPTDEIIAAYKTKKKGFTNILNEQAEILIKQHRLRRHRRKITTKQLTKEIRGKLDFYGSQTKKGRWRIDEWLILGHYQNRGVSRDIAKSVKRILERELNGAEGQDTSV